MKKIDIFPHIFPRSYFDKMVEIIPSKDTIRRWTHIPLPSTSSTGALR